jgi:hypothetical protein
MDLNMALPLYVPYTLARLKSAFPQHLYFLVLFAVTFRLVKPSFVRALAGLLNTHPVPKITTRELLAAMALDRSAQGVTSDITSLVKSWVEEQPYAPGPPACNRLEK